MTFLDLCDELLADVGPTWGRTLKMYLHKRNLNGTFRSLFGDKVEPDFVADHPPRACHAAASARCV
jgi:hypothetical protein